MSIRAPSLATLPMNISSDKHGLERAGTYPRHRKSSIKVFGDLAFEEFIVSPEIDLNDLQKAAAKKLVEKMRYFEKLVNEDLRLEQVIDHPAWKPTPSLSAVPN